MHSSNTIKCPGLHLRAKTPGLISTSWGHEQGHTKPSLGATPRPMGGLCSGLLLLVLLSSQFSALLRPLSVSVALWSTEALGFVFPLGLPAGFESEWRLGSAWAVLASVQFMRRSN